jgi:chromosome segregation ATPase
MAEKKIDRRTVEARMMKKITELSVANETLCETLKEKQSESTRLHECVEVQIQRAREAEKQARRDRQDCDEVSIKLYDITKAKESAEIKLREVQGAHGKLEVKTEECYKLVRSYEKNLEEKERVIEALEQECTKSHNEAKRNALIIDFLIGLKV